MPSLTSGVCVISAWITFLHASLSSAFLSLRQLFISSVLGMNALQSLSASDVHAKRCSRVPCEKAGAGEAVADSKASDTHNCAKGIGRSIRLFWLSMFIIGLASITLSSQIGIHSCRSSRLERNVSVWSFRPLYSPASLQADMRGRPVRSVSLSISGRTNHQGVAGPSKRWERHRPYRCMLN